GLQEAVQPKAVKPRFLDHNHPHRPAKPLLRRPTQLRKQRQQSRPVTRRPHLKTRPPPGELVATSQDLRLSSSAANTMVSSDRVVVGTGWPRSVQDSLHECDWATAFYQTGCRLHRHGICL